jgi:Tfp pilus assembly protein PilN
MSQQINLLNRASRKEPFSFTSLRGMAYAIAAAVTLSLVIGIYERYRLGGVEAEAVQVAAMLKKATAGRTTTATTALQAPPKPDAELEMRLRELQAQHEARRRIVETLRRALAESSGGFSEYMRVFSRQKMDGVWLTGFDIASGGEELTISGRASSADLVPAYLQRLNREAPVQGRQFAKISVNQLPARQSAQPPDAAAGARGAPLSYVEFMVSTNDPSDKTRAGDAAQRSASPWRPKRPQLDDVTGALGVTP